ncbi:glycosyltransferase family 2 protein [Paenibacillus sp. sgz500958]|uniref:glycosyltransferase family 2 protein n=1 Tax=Paenibacillus sp. sgz500958 TaxID=3242475 RepID=UPI0036D27CDF
MINEPLVSVVIPVYNGENYLREAIDSVIAQTYQNIEIIVVNDGSRDEGATERIATSYGNKIRYFHKENGGVATALNLAIREMKGEYFSWLSHDDMYYPGKVELQVRALRASGNMTAIVHGDYDLLDVHSQAITHVTQSKIYTIDQLESSVFPVLQGVVHGCCLLIHRSHFERVGGFDEALISTQDYDLWFRMLRFQQTIYLTEPLVIARVHESQGSRTMNTHKAECEQLHIGFLEKLTEAEMSAMYGSAYNFYHRMCCYFKGGEMEISYHYANKKLQEAAVPEDVSDQLLYLKNYVSTLFDGKTDRICIFGAGQYGVSLYQELRSKLINVDCFSDNNEGKWGYLFDNVYCISPEQLELEKDRTLVIVANRTPTEIVDQLKLKGFPYITTKQELDRELMQIPPVKWITALDDIEGLDFSSKEAILLINKFNQTIFDICKFYEDRLNK